MNDDKEEDSADVENARNEYGMREISAAMVGIYKEQFGRGPESVSTRYSRPDAIISLLSNSLTPVERSMRDMGEAERLREVRLLFQHATEPQFREAVERITGRRVIGFMSGIDVEHDIACEVFTLAPSSREGG